MDPTVNFRWAPAAHTIIFFNPPTAHQRYSGRGNCYALSRVSDVEVVATKAYKLIFFCSLLIIFP